LVELGHDVFLFRLDKYCISNNIKFRSQKYKERLSSDLIEIFKKENSKKNFNIFFSYLTENDIYPAAIDEIKKNSTPTLNFSCNNTHQFYLIRDISKYFDFNLYSEKDAKVKFDKAAANSIWFPMAANPTYYKQLDLAKKYDVTFIGASYAKRADYVKCLLENKIDIHCFGPNWLVNKPYPGIKTIYKELKRVRNSILSFAYPNKPKRFEYSSAVKYYDTQKSIRVNFKSNLHYPVSDDEMIKLYNTSKINLGFLEVFGNDNDPHREIAKHIHLREFEIPMSGNLYITNYFEELFEFYEPDKEIVVFKNKAELLDKVNFFLQNNDVAGNIRKAGRMRALRDHTYQNRFKILFQRLKI